MSRQLPKDVILIGVDGGATEVKAHAVHSVGEAATEVQMNGHSASRVYERLEGFQPIPVTEQLAEMRTGNPVAPTAGECEQGAIWVAAAAEAIGEVVRSLDASGPVLVGMGMPGLKTPDGRGIHVINNGPRIPDFLDRLETLLNEQGVALASPIAQLGSDADYCGIGEEYAAEGLFRDVQDAYYCGCGTGVADAMKLTGKLVPFDEAKSWIQKSWQMPSALGPTFEKMIAAKSFNNVYERFMAAAGEKDIPFPEQAAIDGDALAQSYLQFAALVLAELLFERIDTVYHGRRAGTHRNGGYAELNPNHAYRGRVLERVIVGQRFGVMLADEKIREFFGEPLKKHLAIMIRACQDEQLAAACLKGESLRDGFLVASKLRAAPAIGAAIAAIQAYQSESATDRNESVSR